MKKGSMRSIRNVLIGLAMLSMLVLTACESVGGLDLNQVMKSSANVQSFEGKASFSLEFLLDEAIFDEAELTAEEAAFAQFLKNMKLELTELKQQDMQSMSAAGAFLIGEARIPFAIAMDSSSMVVQVDGIKKPYVIFTDMEEISEMIGMDAQQITELQIDLSKLLVDYFVPNLPNPATIEVEKANVTINGENVDVHKVHAVIQGDELLSLLTKVVQNLAQDEEGLRTFLSDAYDLILPLINQIIEEQAELADELFDPEMMKYVQNKTLAVEFLHTTIIEGIGELAAYIENYGSELVEGLDVLSSDSYFAIDMYVDRNLDVRRTDFEVLIKPSESIDGFAGIQLNASQELWNINQDVAMDMIEYDEFLSEMDPVLPHIEAGSELAQLLTLFGLNETTFAVFPEAEQPEGFVYQRSFIKDGNTMSSGYWLAGQLQLDLEYDESEGIVEIADPATNRIIVLPIGDNTMIVDGEEKEVSVGAMDLNGFPFVPLRAVAEEFGAEVEWDAENRTAIITKQHF